MKTFLFLCVFLFPVNLYAQSVGCFSLNSNPSQCYNGSVTCYTDAGGNDDASRNFGSYGFTIASLCSQFTGYYNGLLLCVQDVVGYAYQAEQCASAQQQCSAELTQLGALYNSRTTELTQLGRTYNSKIAELQLQLSTTQKQVRRLKRICGSRCIKR